MTHTPHSLRTEFPEYADKINELKENDSTFAKLFDRYDEVNHNIHRAETDIEPVSDDYMEAMREQRVALKDKLYAMMKAS